MPYLENNSASYKTEGKSPNGIYAFLLRSRFYYVSRFLQIMFSNWAVAKKRGFSQETWHNAAWEIIKVLEKCGGRFDIKGLANISKVKGPVVFIANHMSTMETFIFPALTYPRKKTVFILKQSLTKIPFFKEFLKDCIAVTRKSPSDDFKTVITKGSEVLNKGFSVIVFPQATRYKTVDEKSFNSLGIKLAKKAQVPVIPVALKTDFWGSGLILRDFGHLDPTKTIFFEFGEPFSVTGSGKQEHERVIDFIRSRLELWEGR